jgi:hypothetical protein
MSKLTPELRPDYTGKLVTRHVRIDDPADALKSFPSPIGTPSLMESKDFMEVKTLLVDILNAYLAKEVPASDNSDASGEDDGNYIDLDDEDGYWNQNDEGDKEDPGFTASELIAPAKIGEALSKFPDRTISHMKAKMDADPYSDDYEIAVLHALTHQHEDDSQFMEYLTHLHSSARDLYPDADVFGDSGVNSYTLIRDYMDNQRRFEHLGYELPENVFEATEKQKSVMEALHFMSVEYGDAWESESDGLVKLVIDHADDVQRIFDVIEERDTKDADVIRRVLESKSPAISSGVL